MPASAERSESDRYDKIDDNIYRMRPLGKRPRPKTLTPFGKALLSGFTIITIAFLCWLYYR